MYHPFHPKEIGWKFESNIIFQIGASNTEIRYIETQLVGKPIQFRTLQYNNFSLQELFPLKKNWIQLQVKKKTIKKKTIKNKKTAHLESITVMLINSVLMTTLIPLYDDINGTFTACSGDVTFWKLKKFWYFTDNHIYNRYYYYISRMLRYQKKLGDCLFFCNLELCFKLRLFSRDICWFWYWREL